MLLQHCHTHTVRIYISEVFPNFEGEMKQPSLSINCKCIILCMCCRLAMLNILNDN